MTADDDYWVDPEGYDRRELVAEIGRLRAALADVIPIAERYVGRSDGGAIVGTFSDKIWKAKKLLTRR